MPRSFALLPPNAGLAVVFPFAVLLAAACGNDPGTSTGDAGSRDLALAPPDLTPHNPPNPAGLGPAPVDVGLATNLAAPGSYVLLAKTAITNVTGSSISGGHLGLSPAAASFI